VMQHGPELRIEGEFTQLQFHPSEN